MTLRHNGGEHASWSATSSIVAAGTRDDLHRPRIHRLPGDARETAAQWAGRITGGARNR